MALNPPQILFILSITVLVSLSFSGADEDRVGGWKEIADPSDSGVTEIGKFAIVQHNKEAKSELKFQKVIRGETQVVAGINYRLVVAAVDGDATNDYEAVVYDKPWAHFRNLTSFKAVAK